MLAQMRARTDFSVPASYLLLPLASYLSWALFMVAWWGAGAGLGTGDLTLAVSELGIVGLVASAAASYVVYLVMSRANNHSSRTRALLWKAVGELQSRTGATGQEAMLPLSSAEEGLYRLSRGEHERSAVLWALLASIPVVGWIFLVTALWFLSRELAKHARLEELVLEDVDRTLKATGLQGASVRGAPVASRDILGVSVAIVSTIELLSSFLLGPAGGLVLIYLTVGAFSLVWLDLAIRDPTVHFSFHSQFEPDILRSLPDTFAGISNVGAG
ncbi:MAG: hypothetical protein AUI97_09020 [Crenarchaeota archaeon 13_1_40CM_3_52_17]|nr:MAG: hypothetical protein AUI97_09020 [Crenarchaeota archaeon 13_1_40CM_3_52_17]